MSDDLSKTPSEEADQRHLDLAREAGEAYQRAVRHTIEDVAHTGDQKQVGDYVVGFAQVSAEGLYHARDGDLEFLEPTAENCHVEVMVSDAADGRFVPHLPVSVTFQSQDGEEVGPADLPFVWHPGVYHYGTNLTLPGDGTYDVHVQIGPAEFQRHDRENGDRYAESVEVRFEDVDVNCGQL